MWFQRKAMWVALPCRAFSARERIIIRYYGFLTFPEFIDNYYIKFKRTRVGIHQFIRDLTQHRDEVIFAVLPDHRAHQWKSWVDRYEDIIWIAPLHDWKECDYILAIDTDNIIVGYPYREYPILRFLRFLRFLREHGLYGWILGFWLESKPEILLNRALIGFDTTIPEYYAYRCNKEWISWKTKRYWNGNHPNLFALFETNVRNFKRAIEKLGIRLICYRKLVQ